MPARNLIILILAAFVSLVCYQTASRNHYGGLLANAIGEINTTFVRPVDSRELFEGAMDGMVRQLDPYSDYIDPEELAAFEEELDQKFGGIGIVVEVNRTTGRLTVLSPLPDTPAFNAGMRAGDQILAIDGKSTEGFQIRDAVDLMRGDPGTSLTVSVLHAGDNEPEEMKLERAIIPVASVLGDVRNPDGTWQYTLDSHPNIGLIRLSTFGEKTAEELRETLTSLEPKIDGLILDLRRNGGGLLHAAVEVCDLFIDSGRIVSIRGRDKKGWRNFSANQNTTLFRDLPLVVLVDGFSASASEITAACLQDHQRAVVVGTRSWGKGTVQNVIPFEGGRSRLKLTVATYWRPSGRNIHRHVDDTDDDGWGVTPNEGYAVDTDEETLKKIVLLRQERDRVKIDREDEPKPNDDPIESGSNLNPTEAAPVEGADQDDLPDLTGFEDPQMLRAIEAIQELISGNRNQPINLNHLPRKRREQVDQVDCPPYAIEVSSLDSVRFSALPSQNAMVNNVPYRSLEFNGLTIEGYSRAAVQSYWRIPELKIGFDFGAQPWDFMGTATWFVSHTHLDHIAAIPVYVARRRMMKMDPPTIYLPEECVDGVKQVLGAFSRLDRGRLPCKLIGLKPNDEVELSRELVVTTIATDHRVPSLGYVVWERRKKLKPEYQNLSGEQIRDIRLAGTEVSAETRIPRLGYLGDSTPAGLDDNPVMYEAEILITELTFIAPDHRPEKIRKLGHIHLDHLVQRRQRFQNQLVIAGHLSTRYHPKQVERIVQKAIPDMLDGRLHLWL